MCWLLPRRRDSQDVNIVNLEFSLLEKLIDGFAQRSNTTAVRSIRKNRYRTLRSSAYYWELLLGRHNRQLLLRDRQPLADILGQCSRRLFVAMAVEVQPRLFIPFAPLSLSPPCLQDDHQGGKSTKSEPSHHPRPDSRLTRLRQMSQLGHGDALW